MIGRDSDKNPVDHTDYYITFGNFTAVRSSYTMTELTNADYEAWGSHLKALRDTVKKAYEANNEEEFTKARKTFLEAISKELERTKSSPEEAIMLEYFVENTIIDLFPVTTMKKN